MLTNYKDKSIALLNQWIEDSTRFDNTNLSIKKYIDFIYEFEINTTFILESSYTIETYKGIKEPSKSDSSFSSDKQFAQAIQNALYEESTSQNNLQLLQKILDSNDYGYIKEQVHFKTRDERLFYSYPCPHCHHGKVRCPSCRGSGKTSCGSCGGAGSFQKSRIVTDFNGNPTTQYYRETCYSCGGSGVNRCSKCGGSGQVQCSNCSGTGYLTAVCTIAVSIKPSYHLVLLEEQYDERVYHALQKTMLYTLESYGEVWKKRSAIITPSEDSAPSLHGVSQKHGGKVPFAIISTRLEGYDIEIVLYGKEIEIFDAGAILDILLQNDLQNLENKSKKAWLNPFIGLSARKTIKTFMESEKNEKLFMLDANHKNQTINEALENKQAQSTKLPLDKRVLRDRELLNRAFSESYIRTALLSMSKIAKAICRFSNVKWFIAAYITLLLASIMNILDTHLFAKGFVHKAKKISYLNPSHLNTKEAFDFGVYWQVLDFNLYIIGAFALFGLFGSLHIRSYFHACGRKQKFSWANGGRHNNALAKWVSAYRINSFLRMFIYPILGVLLIALFLYFFPISIQSKMVYGIVPLAEVKECLMWIRDFFK